MLIDVTKKLKNFDGEAMFLNIEASSEPQTMTVRSTAVVLLSSAIRDEKVPADEALVRFMLAQRIHDEDKVELDVDEISMILKLTAESFTPLVYGRMVELLDPAKLKK